MAKFCFTKKAIDDLTHIWEYTFYSWSEARADKYYYMLIENCKDIARNPELGKDYSIIMNQLYGFRAGRHLIFYRKIENTEVEIIRILHERMDLKNKLRTK